MFKKFALSLICFGLSIIPALCADIQESTISTEASVNQEVMPDTAKIKFSVEESGLNLAAIKEKNDKIVNDAINAIKAQLGENESVKTTSFNVRNVYAYKEKVRVFQKYVVTNGFEVKLKDLNKVSKIINLAMQNGVKNVGNLSFSVEDSQNVCNEMMAQAVKIAKNRAYYIANASGDNISKVKSINPYCSLSANHVNQKVYNSYASARMEMSTDSAAGVIEPIEVGAINARASVNMVYYLK